MDQDQRRYGRAATVLLVVLAAALASRRVIKQPAPPGAAPAGTTLAVSDDSIDRYLAPVSSAAVPRGSAYVGGLGLDPFGSPAVADQPAPAAAVRYTEAPRPRPRSWTLTAILITDARRAAVIDEQLVSVGDRLSGGGRVIAVERDHVVVATADGARRQLTLPDGGV